MGLITRQFGPNAKGSKLTTLEMDNNLYYLQRLGVSGLTYSANTLTITNPTGGTLSVNIVADTNTFVTGGTYSNGTAIFTNNTGGTFLVTGFTTGDTLQQVLVNSNTTNGNNIIMSESDNIIFKYAGFNNNINTEPLTSNRTILFPNNNGTVALLSDIQTFTGGTISGSTIFTNGLTSNTISATTYQNLPIDPNTFVTAFTYSNNVFTLKQNNSQPDLLSTINNVTGLTVNGDILVTGNTTIRGLSASTISATTYYNLPFDKDSSVIITPISSTNTINTLGTNGFLTISNPGTGSSTINGNNYYLSLGKITCRCSANFGAVASVYPSVTSAYAPRLDYGMMASFKFGIDAQATNMRMFVGLGGGTSAPTNVEPDTLTNHIGICKPSGSTNFHIMSNDATGVASLIDLGAGFPANTSQTDVYFLRLWGYSSSVNYVVERYSSTDGSVTNSASGVINTDIPINSTILLPRLYISNNTTNSQVAFMVNRITMSYLQ